MLRKKKSKTLEEYLKIVERCNAEHKCVQCELGDEEFYKFISLLPEEVVSKVLGHTSDKECDIAYT